MKRVCSSCSLEKILEKDFYTQPPSRKHQSGGYLKRCKDCILKYNQQLSRQEKYKERIWENKIQYRYGISKDTYEELLKNQNNCCAICKTKNPSNKRKQTKYFCVDHCHKTGAVRGLLCSTCNSALGLLQDNTDIILSAFNYLDISKSSFNEP